MPKKTFIHFQSHIRLLLLSGLQTRIVSVRLFAAEKWPAILYFKTTEQENVPCLRQPHFENDNIGYSFRGD